MTHVRKLTELKLAACYKFSKSQMAISARRNTMWHLCAFYLEIIQEAKGFRSINSRQAEDLIAPEVAKIAPETLAM